jgi:hypothetical protein
MKILKRAKKKVSSATVEEIANKARQARVILIDPMFSDYRGLIDNSIMDIEGKILNNTVREVHETGTFGSIQRTFITPKRVAIDELAGQYYILNKIKSTLNGWIQDDEELTKAIADGLVEVS